VGFDPASGFGLLFQWTGPQRGPVDAGPLRHEGEEVEVGGRSCPDADDCDPSADRERIEVGGEVRSADELEHDVEGSTIGELFRRHHLACARSRSDRGDVVAQALVPYRRGDVRARHGGKLHGDDPDATGGGVDEHPLAHREPALREQRVVGGGDHLGKAAGRVPCHAVGHRYRRALVDDRQLRLPAPADDGHDAIAGAVTLYVGPGGDDLPGQLEARDVGRASGRGGIEPAALKHVAPVEAGRPHCHQELAPARLRIRVVPPLQLALAHDRDRPHGQ
jgi:hypothetical protein